MTTKNTEKLEQELAKLYANRHSLVKKLAPIEKRIKEIEAIKRKEEEVKLEELKNVYKNFVNFAENHDVTDYFYDKNGTKEIFEDDGTLHVNYGKLRACFISNQYLSRREFLAEAKPLIKELIEKFGYRKEDIRI